MRNTHLLAAFLYIFLVPCYSSQGGEGGHGIVNLRGSIVDTPCAIDTTSRDQSIDMGATPVAVIARDGRSNTRPFSIRLVNCHLDKTPLAQSSWRYFQVTFDGHSRKGVFLLSGGAKGIGLEIADAAGNIARPGIPMMPGALSEGEQRLDYTMRLVSNEEPLRAGGFNSTLRFKMDYY